MKLLPDQYGAFLDQMVTVYTSRCVCAPVKINKSFLFSKPSKTRDEIFQSLEGMSAGDSIKTVTKEIREYLVNIDAALNKYVETLKKMVNLIKDSLVPLINTHNVFEKLYGDKLENLYKQVKVSYFRNNHTSTTDRDGSVQLFAVELLAIAFYNSEIDKVRMVLTDLLESPVNAKGNIEFSSMLNTLTAIPKDKVSIADLGYPIDYLKHGLRVLTETGGHITLYENVNKLTNYFTKIHESIEKELPGLNGPKPNEVAGRINQLVETYNTCNVGLGSLLALLQAVSYAAYQAMYTLHVAEIEQNKQHLK